MEEPRPRASPVSGMRVLLVEDDPAQLDEYLRILDRFGCVVFPAATAEAGIEWARSVPLDAIMTDHVLPGMSGLRSIAEYAKSTRAPVLVMTSHFDADLEKDARLLGAKAAFAKPLILEALAGELAAFGTTTVDPQGAEELLTPEDSRV